MPKRLTILLFILFLAIMGAIIFFSYKKDLVTPPPEESKPVPVETTKTQAGGQPTSTTPVINSPKPTTTMETKKAENTLVTLKTTLGDIEIELTDKATPKTAENFVSLAQKRFYDGTTFHRVMKGFMIQGGDPKGDGTGNPGYRFDDEPFEGEYTRGTVAMANAGPNTNGSQFFIMHADYPLPKNYVIFGRVIKGLNVVDAIAESPVTYGASGEPSKPVKPVVVERVEVKK